ncbi:hypothetical protein BaRGS_00013165 [Batillaria attramentaria]|uniref:Uncharacterized protein n=1 Tax=Batillaria attramentaria TaxID=370345 RepID=A0ABD0L963_9CAEN
MYRGDVLLMRKAAQCKITEQTKQKSENFTEIRKITGPQEPAERLTRQFQSSLACLRAPHALQVCDSQSAHHRLDIALTTQARWGAELRTAQLWRRGAHAMHMLMSPIYGGQTGRAALTAIEVRAGTKRRPAGGPGYGL